jgi:hypothetical protein
VDGLSPGVRRFSGSMVGARVARDHPCKGGVMVRRFAIALMATPLLLTLLAETAAAAPPSNDTFAGATPVNFGFSEELDTTEATTDADDAQLNTCGAPATDASVWYAFTSPVDALMTVDVLTGSSYTPAVLVGVGTQGNLETVVCGFGVTFAADAETTYYVLVIDPQADGGGNGGTLRITFGGGPTPTVDVAADPVGRVDARTGIMTVTGSYTCTLGDVISVGGNVQQARGKITTFGFFRFEEVATCDGTTRSWSADVIPENGKFRGGDALAATLATTCVSGRCVQAREERTVKLRAAS